MGFNASWIVAHWHPGRETEFRRRPVFDTLYSLIAGLHHLFSKELSLEPFLLLGPVV
jgi:hypothetical protein